MDKEDKLMQDQGAAYKFVDQMVARKDGIANAGYFWHGWALRKAFLSGIEYERAEKHKESLK